MLLFSYAEKCDNSVMSMYFTEGLVLKKDPYGEADALVTLLTRDFGKIRGVAQGVRKQEAKLKGHFEVFSHSVVGFVIGKNFYRFTGADMKDFFPALRASSSALRGAAYIGNILDKNTFEEQGDPRLFELVHDAFCRLNDAAGASNTESCAGTCDIESILFWFHTRLLGVLGLLPEPGLQRGMVNSLVREHLGAIPPENQLDAIDIRLV